MKFTLKRLLELRERELTESTNEYSYISKHSKQYDPNILIECYLCFHYRNCKTILVDDLSWIYCEITPPNVKFNDSMLLKRFSLNDFNVITECLNKKDYFQKTITYIQFDLSVCKFDDSWDLKEVNPLSETDHQISAVKTHKFYYALNTPLQSPNKHTFKVIHKSLVRIVASSQHQTRLRADIKILINLGDGKRLRECSIALVSDFLYYYSFLIENETYELDVIGDITHDICTNTSFIIFLNKNMRIKLSLIKINDNFSKQKQSIDVEIMRESIQGRLLAKDVVLGQSQDMLPQLSDRDKCILKHFDILMPQLKLKLTLRNETDDLVIYFDANKTYTIYPFGILLGSNVIIYDLSKAPTAKYFKSTMSLHALSMQTPINGNKMIDVNTNLMKSNSNDLLTELDSFDLIFDYYNAEKVPLKSSNMRVLAQVQKIYELSIKLICNSCKKLFLNCSCSQKNLNTNTCVQFSCKFQIDDHTSVLKLLYKNNNYDLFSKQSIFRDVSSSIYKLLKNCGQIEIQNIVNTTNDNDSMTNEENQDSRCNFKIRRILNDYLYNCVVNCYFLFDLDIQTRKIKPMPMLNLSDLTRGEQQTSFYNTISYLECRQMTFFES